MRRIICACACTTLVALGANSDARAEFPQIRLEPIVQDEIVSPVAITHAGDGSQRLFVADQRGSIHIVENGSRLPTPFLDISSTIGTREAKL